jgi:hypothetical protein
MSQRITDDERAEVIRLYVEGLSTHKVAAEVGRAQSAVWRILDTAGVPRRRQGWPKDARTHHRDVPPVSSGTRQPRRAGPWHSLPAYAGLAVTGAGGDAT